VDARRLRGVGDATLNRFFSFHVIAVPLVLIGLVRAHRRAARSRLQQPGRRRDQEEEGRERHPARRHPLPPVLHGEGHRRRRGLPDRLLSAVVFFMPEGGGYFLEYNNFIPADPLKTPPHIAPVWYFTPFYSILRAVTYPLFGIDAKFWGVVAMGRRW
jgi:ubiquinol-cytochrome c reductase cytochrome b subunit